MNKPLILVVEDDTAVRNLIVTTLETHDYRFQAAPTGEIAIMEAASHNPDVILLDLGLPDMDGIDIIRKIRTCPRPPLLSSAPEARIPIKSKRWTQGLTII